MSVIILQFAGSSSSRRRMAKSSRKKTTVAAVGLPLQSAQVSTKKMKKWHSRIKRRTVLASSKSGSSEAGLRAPGLPEGVSQRLQCALGSESEPDEQGVGAGADDWDMESRTQNDETRVQDDVATALKLLSIDDTTGLVQRAHPYASFAEAALLIDRRGAGEDVEYLVVWADPYDGER